MEREPEEPELDVSKYASPPQADSELLWSASGNSNNHPMDPAPSHNPSPLADGQLRGAKIVATSRGEVVELKEQHGRAPRQKRVETCEIIITAPEDSPAGALLKEAAGDAEGEMDEPRPFVRSVKGRGAATGEGLGAQISRLSTAIRRSLKLGPKRTTTKRREEAPTRAKAFGEEGPPFTEFTNLRREHCERPFGTIAELNNFIQLNKQTQVKKFIRHNDWPVSHEIRADLWRVLCHSKDFDSNKQLYLQQLEELTKSGVKTLRPSFLSMEGIVIEDHGLKEQGVVALQRLLIVVECVRPEIRYVPILYPLCAMFLHYMSAEETFACVMRLLSQGNTFILQSELAVFASCHTLLSLLKKHKRSVYSMLKRRAGTSDDVKLAEVFAPWTAWIFKHMPFEYLARVMDCFLVEGHKMLLRIALSLVYIWYKERSRAPLGDAPAAAGKGILRAQTMPTRTNNQSVRAGKKGAGPGDADSIDARVAEVRAEVAAVAQMPNCPISVQTLLDMGCSIRNFKHSTFEHRQKHYEDKFREQVARRRADQVQLRTKHTIYTAAFESKIIDSEAASELMCALPSRFQLETPQLLFRLSEHGASFVQLWTQIDDAEQSLLIIRSTNNEIFGAYCSSCWVERRDLRERTKTRYFGTGESFVWHLHADLQLPVIHYWAGKHIENPDGCPQMFMTAGDKFLIIGSGGGDAIAVRDELTRGLSYACDTFASPALVEGNAFEIDELEVYNVIGSRGSA